MRECSTCGYRSNCIGDAEVLMDRDTYWHRKCARMLDDNHVGFPSTGQMIRDTLMHEEGEE